MNSREISLVGVRLLGLYLIAQGIFELPNLVVLAQLPPDAEFTSLLYFLHASAILAPLILGAVVLVFSSRIANLIQPEPMSSTMASRVSLEEVQSFVFAALGLAICVVAFPKLLSTWTFIYQSNSINERPLGYLSTPAFISPLAGVLFGLFLFVGARFWTRMYNRFREFGLEQK